MRTPRLFPIAVLFALGLSLRLPAADPAFDAWVNRLTADAVRADPNSATATQFFTGAEQDALDRQLTPVTKAYRVERAAFARRALAELAALDRTKLDPQQVVSARIIEWHMQQVVLREPFADHTLVFNQFWGLHTSLVNFLSQQHPIRNRRDIENYLARLGLVAARIDEGIAEARAAAARGFLMPDFITRASLGQLDRFLEGGPARNGLVTSLAERAAKVEGLPAADRAAFVAAAEKIAGESILPAFERVRALLQEQLPRTTADAGMWRLPDGEKAYAVALGYSTTTQLSAREIHEIGLKEVTRIEAEMDRLFRQLGYNEGTIVERCEKLNRDLQPPAEPDPRPALLKRYEGILADAVRRAQDYFDLQPKAACEVRREPPFTEKTAAAHYSIPARDGSRPGVFWMPLPGPTFRMINMRTVTYHEGIPGHHYQLALIQEMTDLPRFRQDRIFGGNSANSEGWALYAEQLAAEAGWYEGDIPGRLGQLEGELARARRLVIDTGIHAMRWTRQQAIDYGLPGFNAATEVERYVSIPGQACAYKIGQLKILELRTRAQTALKGKFSIKEFHNVVLRAGVVPLAVLESIVDDWIAASKTF
ncbi:MAG TPA: DUF885 domain-containing protein [Lacunisphaera sp.]|nr:DUF885 domain-containing protein [Lacunisphaera sp.]